MIRSFIALEIPPRLRTELAKVVSLYAPRLTYGVNWVKPENMHLTLLFIGDVPEPKLSEIKTLLEAQLQGFPAFSFQAEGLELFPAKDPRVLWLKLSSANEDIFKLNRRLLREISSLGIEPDRKALKLHITVARLRTRFSADLERELMQTPMPLENQSFGSVCLFKSVLHPTGPQYTIMHKYNLTGG